MEKIKIKDRDYYLRIATIRTIILAIVLFLSPITAHFYRKAIGEQLYNETWGYPIAGTGILILLSLILTIRAFAFAFDSDLRLKNQMTDEEYKNKYSHRF